LFQEKRRLSSWAVDGFSKEPLFLTQSLDIFLIAQGVLYESLRAFGAAAQTFTLFIASSGVPSTTLLRPATTMTFLGPKNI